MFSRIVCGWDGRGLNCCLTGVSDWDEGMILEADGDDSIIIFWLYLITLHCIFIDIDKTLLVYSVYLNCIYCIFKTVKIGLGGMTQSVQD